MPKILSAEKFCPPKILSAEILSVKVLLKDRTIFHSFSLYFLNLDSLVMLKYPRYDISKMLDFPMIFKESGRRPISSAEFSAESQKKDSNIYRFLSLSKRDIIYFVIEKKTWKF